MNKHEIFQAHFEKSKKLHEQIQDLYNQIYKEHEANCVEAVHNQCMFDLMDERLTTIVMLEKEITVIRRQLKRDIHRYEDDPEAKKKRLAILREIERVATRTLSARKEYAEL